MSVFDEDRHPLRELLSCGHAHLNEVFDHLLACAHMDDRERTRAAFCRFEDELEGHMRAEELHLLPYFALNAASEAARLQREHDLIRQQIEQLGIDLDLHALRAARVQELVRALREHAAREEKMLYPWAESNLTQREKTALASHLPPARLDTP